MIIRQQKTEYVFYWSGEQPEWSKLSGMVESSDIRYASSMPAMAFLRRFPNIFEFRKFLEEGLRGQTQVMDSNAMVAKLAELMVKGRIKVVKRWVRAVSAPSTAGGPLIEMPRRQVAERVEESEPSTLPSSNDNEAQAQALTEAAENGDAFCEECAKAAAAARQPAPAPVPPPPAETDPYTDPDAQAKTLKQAAKDGTPFCEECEKAKKAAA